MHFGAIFAQVCCCTVTGVTGYIEQILNLSDRGVARDLLLNSGIKVGLQKI